MSPVTTRPPSIHPVSALCLPCVPPVFFPILQCHPHIAASLPVAICIARAKMPRDLLAEKQTLESMPKLSREPDALSSPEPEEQSSLVPHRSSNIAQEERLRQLGVRPFSSLLNIDDLDDCDWLEHAAFDPIEAATREKVRAIRHCHLSAFSLLSSSSPSCTLRYVT
jgi:hypothetical protein